MHQNLYRISFPPDNAHRHCPPSCRRILYIRPFHSTELPFSGGSPSVKTASSKKQKVAHPVADDPRHAYHQAVHDPDRQPSSPQSSSSPSSNQAAHTPSSPPRYIPPHLHADSRASSPSDAYAQLNLAEDMSHSSAQGDTDAPNPTQRPASPAKRSAATMEGIESAADPVTSNESQQAPPSYDAHQQDASPSITPSFEEQVTRIQAMLNVPVEDGSKVFIVAAKWFHRVMARTADADQKVFDPEMLEGEVGNIDNSSLVAPGKCSVACCHPRQWLKFELQVHLTTLSLSQESPTYPMFLCALTWKEKPISRCLLKRHGVRLLSGTVCRTANYQSFVLHTMSHLKDPRLPTSSTN